MFVLKLISKTVTDYTLLSTLLKNRLLYVFGIVKIMGKIIV